MEFLGLARSRMLREWSPFHLHCWWSTSSLPGKGSSTILKIMVAATTFFPVNPIHQCMTVSTVKTTAMNLEYLELCFMLLSDAYWKNISRFPSSFFRFSYFFRGFYLTVDSSGIGESPSWESDQIFAGHPSQLRTIGEALGQKIFVVLRHCKACSLASNGPMGMGK